MTPLRVKGHALAEIGVTLWKDPASVRFLRPWLRTLRSPPAALHDGLPWMNFKVIRWLDAHLRPTMDVFEYGSGGSTAFVARRVRRLVSVESEEAWYRTVADGLRREGIRNCDLRCVPPDALSGPEPPYGPRSYTSYAPHTRGHSFEAYVRTIDAHPDGSLDLVIVDGYARPSAVTHAIPKVKRGGFLLLDDSDRAYTAPALPLLAGFPRTDFIGASPFQRSLQQTSVWRL